MAYKSIGDYISKIMAKRKENEILHGDFYVSVTDMSEVETNCVAAMIHLHGEDCDTADFLIYKDGREEYRPFG